MPSTPGENAVVSPTAVTPPTEPPCRDHEHDPDPGPGASRLTSSSYGTGTDG